MVIVYSVLSLLLEKLMKGQVLSNGKGIKKGIVRLFPQPMLAAVVLLYLCFGNVAVLNSTVCLVKGFDSLLHEDIVI